jgi:hypothetical protein
MGRTHRSAPCLQTVRGGRSLQPEQVDGPPRHRDRQVSATKDAQGQWHIEPAELHRVYPLRTEASNDERIRTYAAEIALLRDRIEDLRTLTDEFRDGCGT